MNSILITGGNGFLGKNLQKILISNDCKFFFPSSEEVNCLNEQSLIDFIHQNRIDIILHMAAKCAGIGGNANNPAVFLRDNTQMALNIYEAARKCGIKKVYSLGSVCMYPLNCPTPFKEDDIWNGKPELTNAPYGQGKRTLMMLGQTYRQQFDIGGAHLIPVNLFGPGDHFDLQNSHVIPALINKFDAAIKSSSDEVECWGSGTTTSREFLYVEDCAEAISQTILSGFDCDLPINLGTGQEITIFDLAHLISQLMKYRGQITFNGKLDGQPKRCLDVSRAKQMINWEAKTLLREGLIKTIEWYRNQK